MKADKEISSFLKKNKPCLVAIGYSGLLPKLDKNQGAKMAELIVACRSAGSKVILDTHTMNEDYSMLIMEQC